MNQPDHVVDIYRVAIKRYPRVSEAQAGEFSPTLLPGDAPDEPA